MEFTNSTEKALVLKFDSFITLSPFGTLRTYDHQMPVVVKFFEWSNYRDSMNNYLQDLSGAPYWYDVLETGSNE